MEKLARGLVRFDPLLVMGRDFLPAVWKHDTGFYDYAFGVSAYVSQEQPADASELVYEYVWEGHINICIGSARIHLHNPHNDHGLFLQEKKLALVKETIDAFVKEHKSRVKKGGDETINIREWINEGKTHFTGYVTYELRNDGGGMLAVADCHKSLHWWLDVWRDEKGRIGKDESRARSLQQIETLSKGLTKAIDAIRQLRKFFDRELGGSA